MKRATPRVLHVGPLPPPQGGVGVMMEFLMEAKPLQVFDNIYFNTSSGTTLQIAGYKNFELKRVLRRIKLAVQLAFHAWQLRPDIIHFHCGSGGRWDFPGEMLVFLGAKLCKARMIFHWHRNPAEEIFPGNSVATQSFFGVTAGTADALLVLSERYRQNLPDIYSAKTFIIPNTFDTALLSLPCPKPPKSYIQVNFIGRLTREKGIWDLLQVAAEVVIKVPNICFVLAGAPSPAEGLMAPILEAIANLGLERNVRIVGTLLKDEKLQFFYEGDIMLLPSYRESFGMVALEGMASGTPVLAYSLGLLPELIGNGLAGFLVDLGDIHGLASRLLQLIRDPELRVKMGQSGRDEAKQKYAADLIASKVRDIYTGLLGLDSI